MDSNSPEQAALRRLLFDQLTKNIAEESPEWMALMQDVFRGPLIRFTGSSLEEMSRFVLKGTRITPERFDRDSLKSRAALHTELKREVNLYWNPRSMPTREIIRSASNARCIIYSSDEDLALCEVGRKVLETGKTIMHATPKPFGCSETALRYQRMRDGVYVHEASIVTMIRAFIEEAGIGIDDRHLVRLSKIPEISDHPSSVYRCSARFRDSGLLRLLIRSIVMSHMFGLNMRSIGIRSIDEWAEVCPNVRKEGDRFLVEDQGVELIHQALPLEERWRRILLAKLGQHGML
jgi:hypothetical protein